MKHEIESSIASLCKELFNVDGIQVELTRPEEQFGDYASNVALQLASQLHLRPREIAEVIAQNLQAQK